MRALAALYVMLHHAFCCFWAPWLGGNGPSPQGIYWWITMPVVWGHFAVTVFLAISGFCLMLPVVRNDYHLKGGAMNFYGRRMTRIVPPYLFGCLLSLALIQTLIGHPTGSHWDRFIPVTAQDLLGHLLLIHNLYGTGPQKINGAYWSIAVEWQIYFWLPLIVWACRRSASVQAALPAAVLLFFTAAAYLLCARTFATPVEGLTLQYYGVFALGALGAVLSYDRDGALSRLRARVPWAALGSGLLLATAAVCGHWGYQRIAPHFWQLDGVAGVAAVALMIDASVSERSVFRRMLSAKPLVRIGAFSYSLYLVHEPVQQVLWQYGVNPLRLPAGVGVLLLMALSLLLILPVAYGFHLAFERPFMPGRPRAERRAEQTAVVSSAP